jgi:hypothetical protein
MRAKAVLILLDLRSRILQLAHLNRWRHLHPTPPVVR